ncbi:MAG: hypothetical protein JRH11_19665 [Deltaproteobacteria bacterium]|nr:hypothetical protein [Deltaproteobacteria bacterium]
MHNHAHRILALCAVVTALLVTTGASAQDTGRSSEAPVTQHDFTDADQVVGDTVGPAGWLVTVRRPGNRPSLIRFRTHFRDALLKSVEVL